MLNNININEEDQNRMDKIDDEYELLFNTLSIVDQSKMKNLFQRKKGNIDFLEALSECFRIIRLFIKPNNRYKALELLNNQSIETLKTIEKKEKHICLLIDSAVENGGDDLEEFNKIINESLTIIQVRNKTQDVGLYEKILNRPEFEVEKNLQNIINNLGEKKKVADLINSIVDRRKIIALSGCDKIIKAIGNDYAYDVLELLSNEDASAITELVNNIGEHDLTGIINVITKNFSNDFLLKSFALLCNNPDKIEEWSKNPDLFALELLPKSNLTMAAYAQEAGSILP